MEFRVLGAVEAVRDGQLVAVDSTKQRGLLAMLLIHANEAVSTDRLMDALWGEDPPDGGVKTLRFHVSKLRDALDPDRTGNPLITKSPGYMIEADEAAIDAARFELLVDEAKQQASTDPHAAAESLVEALSLWRGRAYHEFQYEEFAVGEAKRLDEARLGAVEDRIDLELSLGRHFDLVPELEALVVEHPLRERLTEMWMLALYRAGRQAESLRAFQVLRQRLVDELGADPGPSVVALEQRILEQDPGLDVRIETRPTGVARAVRGYELRSEVRVTSLGKIYRAYQPAMGREVAIEVIGAEHADRPEFIQRFEAEARPIAALAHPFIVPLWDYWREPGGAYLVSRWLRGGDLAGALQRGSFRAVEAVAILDRIGTALSHAHRLGVVHLDVHPARVALDDDGSAFLGGFGEERLLEASAGGATANGGLTPSYSAPEQLTGSTTGPWTDLYQLGLIAFELLTGRHPFSSTTPERTVGRRLEEAVPLASKINNVLPADVDEVLRRATSHLPQDRHPSIDEFMKELREALDVSEPTVRSELRNPYKGLAAFQAADAADFFGRDEAISRIIDRLAESGEGHRFLALVGPSGSGKSSVARAGVIPALRRGGVSGSERWLFADMIPGEDPYDSLQKTLRRVMVGGPTDMATPLRRDSLGIHETVRRSLPGEGWEFFLLVDQFEELFTATPSEDGRRFIDGLVAAVAHPRSQLRVLVTLRADHYDKPLQHPALAELMRTRSETVPPITGAELEEAITAPAHAVGMDVEPGLVGQILADVAEQPGALPLVQYVLTELFEARSTGMSLAAYRELGGVAGALSQRADGLVRQLSPSAQKVVKTVFLDLVELGEGVADSRRVIGRTALQRRHRTAALDEILECFGEARLLSFNRDPVTRSATVEVAHEALLREWRTLKEWIDVSRDDLRNVRRIQVFADEWEASGRDHTMLLQGSRLAAADDVSDPSVDEFLERSRHARSRGQLRGRLAIAFLVVLALIASGLAFVAADGRRRADEAARLAEQRRIERLAGQAEALAATDPALGLAAALEARGRYSSQIVDQALLAAGDAFTGRVGVELRTIRNLAGRVWGVDFIADSSRMITANDNTRGVQIWNTVDGSRIERLEDLHELSPRQVTVLPDRLHFATSSLDGTVHIRRFDAPASVAVAMLGHTEAVWKFDVHASSDRMVTGSVDGTARVWSLDDGVQLLRVNVTDGAADDSEEPPLAVWSVKFSPSGTQFATATEDGWIRVFDSASGELRVEIEAHERPAQDLVFLDESILLTAGDDGAVLRWDLESGTRAAEPFRHESGVRAIALSPDARLLAVSGAEGLATVWDLESSTRVANLRGHLGVVWDIEFSPDGSVIATAADDGVVKLWDARRSPGLPTFVVEDEGGQSAGYRSAAYTSDGSLFAASRRDGSIHVWDASSGAYLYGLVGHADEVRHIAFSPDNRFLLSGSSDGAARVWNLAAGDFRELEVGQKVRGVGWSPDGSTVVVGQLAGDVLRWDTSTWMPLPSLDGHGAAGNRELAVSASHVAIAGGDNTVILHDLVGGTTSVLEGHTLEARVVAFSPDGALLASASGDGTVRVYATTGGSLLDSFSAHDSGIRALAFSPDGSMLATGSEDVTVKVWTVDGQLLLTSARHTKPVWEVVFSNDGNFLASASDDRTVQIVRMNYPADSVCEWLHTYVVRDELEEAIGEVPQVCVDLPRSPNG